MSNIKKSFIELKPTQIIVIGFLVVILIGTLLLLLPISRADGVQTSFVDALFTATSCVCVTGLSVVNTLGHWTLFGKFVLLILIQMGGIGFMTIFTLILVFMGKKITLKERILIKESFNLDHFQGMVKFVKRIFKGTFIIELIGAVVISTSFIPKYGFFDGLFRAGFHSVSAFCNAGFDIVGETSLIPYATDYVVSLTHMFLTVLGGLGFTVWFELYNIFRERNYKGFILKNKIAMMSLHSKLVLTTTIFFIFAGGIFFLLAEFNNPQTIGNLRIDQKILVSFFNSAALRTSGFDTMNQAGLTYASQLVSILFMIVGGSPGSTAGGMKTITVAVILIAVVSVIKGRDSICAFKKSISFTTLQKALSVLIMITGTVFIITIVLTFAERNAGFEYELVDLLYETTSAVATVGFSTGITAKLSLLSKLFLCLGMFIGRLGPITVAAAISLKQDKSKNLVYYPEESVLVG